jgi:hypothetical protein
VSDLKLYEVTVNDAISYWVAARSPAECVSLITEIDPEVAESATSFEEKGDGWRVEPKDPALLLDKLIHDDDSTNLSGKSSLVGLFRECDTPSVIACSEW